MSGGIPSLAVGTVISADPLNYRVSVILDGPGMGGGPSVPLEILTRGPRDGARGHYGELPTRGTKVLIGFPRGALTNGVILGSLPANLLNTNPFGPGEVGSRSDSHWSGRWSYSAESGSHVEQFPDGTAILIGPTNAPTVNRTTLDGRQAPVKTPFAQSQRVANAPAPFPVSLRHASGTVAAINSTGSMTVTAAAGQSLTLVANGATIIIDASGNISATAAGTVAISSPTTVTVTAPSIVLGDGGTTQNLMTAAGDSWIQTHQHSGVQTGGGITGPPTTTIPSNGLTSIVRAQ